jgi:hypothetical protein
MEAKIDHALNLIQDAILTKCNNPIVASSFGKDSMVLLDLVRRAGFKLPILFFREPFFPKKYMFANYVIHLNDYVVYDFPPEFTGLVKRNGTMEVINIHKINGKEIYLPTGIKPPLNGEPFLCALRDLYNKPTGTYNAPWDLLLIGHKSSDIDPVLGPVPLKSDVVAGNPTYVFPLRAFADEDIWNYHQEFNLPINTKRYDADNNWKEFQDTTYNPDYFPACTACMDPDNEPRVFCPLLGEEIDNVASTLRYGEAIPPQYVGTE